MPRASLPDWQAGLREKILCAKQGEENSGLDIAD